MTTLDQLSLDERLRIDQMCSQWEATLVAGSTGSIEDVLGQVTAPASRRALLVELLLTRLDHLASARGGLSAAATPACSPCLIQILEKDYQRYPELARTGPTS